MKKLLPFLFLCMACGAPPVTQEDINNFYIEPETLFDGGEIEMRRSAGDSGLGAKLAGWGASGQLVQGGGSSRQVSLQVEFPLDMATSYTVQFRTSVPPGQSVNAEALITWSVEGQFVTRRVSIGDGTSVTGVGQAVKVVIQDNTPLPFIASPPVQYSASVQVAPGFRGASEVPPTLSPFNNTTGYRFIVAPLSAANIPIPQDAGANQVFVTVVGGPLGTPIANGTAIVLATGVTVGTLKEWDALLTPTWIPLPPGTDTISCSNFGAIPLTYTVTLGIEG